MTRSHEIRGTARLIAACGSGGVVTLARRTVQPAPKPVIAVSAAVSKKSRLLMTCPLRTSPESRPCRPPRPVVHERNGEVKSPPRQGDCPFPVVYNETVERGQWAKAHFFIAINECQSLVKKRRSPESRKLHSASENPKDSKSSTSSCWVPAAVAFCAFSSTVPRVSPMPIANSFLNTSEPFWMWKTSYLATAIR